MITMYLILAMFAGVFIRFMYKLSTAMKAGREFNWKLSLITAVVSFVTNLFLIFVRDDLTSVLPFNYLLAGLYGYIGDSIFRGVTKLSAPKFGNKSD